MTTTNPDLTLSADEIRGMDYSPLELRWLVNPYGETTRPAAPARVLYVPTANNVPSDTVRR